MPPKPNDRARQQTIALKLLPNTPVADIMIRIANNFLLSTTITVFLAATRSELTSTPKAKDQYQGNTTASAPKQKHNSCES